MTSSKYKRLVNVSVFYAKLRLEAESSRNFAGYIWWVLDPVIGVLIYYLLFKVILNRGEDDFLFFLFVGLFLWKWISDSIIKSSNSIYQKLSLIKKVNIAKVTFPVTEVFYNTWKAIIVLGFLLGLFLICGYRYDFHILYLPYLMFSTLIMIAGISIFVSAITPFYPDFNFFLSYFFRLAFYPSGIVFDESIVPVKYRFLMDYNPVAGLTESFRRVIMYNQNPDYLRVSFSMVIGLFFLIAGLALLKKNEQTYAKLL